MAIITLSTLSTLYDVYTRQKKKESFLIFSIVDNFKNLMKINESESAIRCIDGLKVISSKFFVRVLKTPNKSIVFSILDYCWASRIEIKTFVQCLTWCWHIFCMFGNFSRSIAYENSWEVNKVEQSFDLLNYFFRNQLNLIKIYVNRFARYFVIIAIIILFSKSSWPRTFADDPNEFETAVKVPCSQSWKASLFLYQNYREIKVSEL